MRPILVKTYGHLYPVPETCFTQAKTILETWNIEEAVFFEKDMVRFSFEGDYFPCDEIVEILKTFHTHQTEGKLDCIDLEEWTLTRHSFEINQVYKVNKASLNNAIEKTQMPFY